MIYIFFRMLLILDILSLNAIDHSRLAAPIEIPKTIPTSWPVVQIGEEEEEKTFNVKVDLLSRLLMCHAFRLDNERLQGIHRKTDHDL